MAALSQTRGAESIAKEQIRISTVEHRAASPKVDDYSLRNVTHCHGAITFCLDDKNWMMGWWLEAFCSQTVV